MKNLQTCPLYVNAKFWQDIWKNLGADIKESETQNIPLVSNAEM